MADRLVDPIETKEDKQLKLSLMPASLKEFIGQGDLKTKLLRTLRAAEARNEPADHILIYGAPGLGKTSLASLIHSNTRFKSAGSFSSFSDVALFLKTFNIISAKFVVVEEIHNIKQRVAEGLYPALDEYKYDAGHGYDNIKPFTMVGLTTNMGAMPQPLRDRFSVQLRLNYYSTLELSQILKVSANKLNTEIKSKNVLSSIAQRSRQTPRIANRLLKRIRDYSDSINSKLVEEAVGDWGIDQEGYDQNDYDFIKVLLLVEGRPLGLNNIAARLATTEETIENYYEPYLLRTGIIERTPKGRILRRLPLGFKIN